jgi:hypothetical protein
MPGLLDLPAEVLTEILDRLPLLSWPAFSLTCVHLAQIVANHVPGCAAKMGLRPEKTSLTTLIAVQQLCYPIYLNEPRQIWCRLTPNYIVNYILYQNPSQGFNILLALEPTQEDLTIFHPLIGSLRGGIHVLRYWVEQLHMGHTLPSDKIVGRAIRHGRPDAAFYLLDNFPALFTIDTYHHMFWAAQYDEPGVLRRFVEHGCVTAHEDIMVQLLIGRCKHMGYRDPAQKDRLDVIMHFVARLQGKTEGLLWRPGEEWTLTCHFLMVCVAHNHAPALKFFMTTFVPFFLEKCSSFAIKGLPKEASVARLKTFILTDLLPFTKAESEVACALMDYIK